MTFTITRKEEVRRFLTTLLLVSVAVLAIGVAGGFVLLRRIEAGLLANQTRAAEREAAVIASEFSMLRWQLFGAAVPTLLLISFVGVGLARSLGARFEHELAARNATLESRVRERTAELSKALGELQAAHERLLQGEKMHLLGELMAGIAHEINNPLTVISGYGDLLSAGAGSDPRKAGAIIAGQTRRVGRIVRNLLDFARNRPVERIPGSLTEVLQSALELVVAELRRANIVLDSTISPELPLVLMDMQQMEQVFINLVRNAAQALAEQPGERRIHVRAFTDGVWVAVQVHDNGPGIPAGLRSRMFDSFVTTKTDGTGLGLSLCKRFVEAHGGCLELMPPNGQSGACFQFRLPALAAGAPVEIHPAADPSYGASEKLRVGSAHAAEANFSRGAGGGLSRKWVMESGSREVWAENPGGAAGVRRRRAGFCGPGRGWRGRRAQRAGRCSWPGRGNARWRGPTAV